MARRSISMLVASVLAVAALTPVHAAEGPELATFCATVSGEPPPDGWTEFELQDAIAAGEASVTLAPIGTCHDLEPDPALGRPLPLVIGETYLVVRGPIATYVVLVTNPNPEPWTARRYPVRIDAVAPDGTVADSIVENITIPAGEEGVIIGSLIEADDGDTLAVTVEGDATDFERAAPPHEIEIGEHTTAYSLMTDWRTEGLVSGRSDASQIWIMAVYRDAGGDVIGGGRDLIEGVNEEGVAFETRGSADGEVATTDVYYEVPG